MRLVAQLEELLYHFQVRPDEETLRLKGWRIFIHEMKSVALGIKDNSPGSVYTPPTYREGESGEVFLVWADGRLSQARVQAKSAEVKDPWIEELRGWRQAAYEDPEGGRIVEPAPLPLAAVEDERLEKILAGEDEVLFAQLERLLYEKPDKAKLQAQISAAWGYRHVRTSTGLAVTYQESQYGLSFSFDRLVGGGFAKRRLIEPEEWKDVWQNTLLHYEALQEFGPAPGSKTAVILAPAVAEEMLGQYILPNFSGQNVLERRSAFTKERFEQKEGVFAPEVSLVVDPLQPFEWGSYLVTPEGVPAERTVLVRKGALASPLLTVKDAGRWGASPTALPQGTSGLYLSHAREEDWERALQGVDDGVLVLSVLGLHTQDSVSGDYSLSAPQSLRILNGKFAGRVDVKVNGNFFKDLAHPALRMAKTQRNVVPYLWVQSGMQSL